MEISKQRVEAMRAKGMPWQAIANECGVSAERLRKAIDPEFARKMKAKSRRDYQKLMLANAESGILVYAGINGSVRRPSREDIEARLAEIPSDTRGLTARIMGDPLPGRRALDRLGAN